MTTRKLTMGALCTIAACLLVPRADAAVSPSGFFLKVYAFAVSTSPDCSNPIVVHEDADPKYVDFAKDPTLGAFSVPDGTYPCVMFTMSDFVRFSPAESEGACVKGAEYTLDVCSSHGEQGEAPGFTRLDGSQGKCAAASGTEDRVTIFLSTAATGAGGGEGQNPFAPPGPDGAGGIQLGAPLVVSGQATGTLVVDARGKVESLTHGGGSPAQCDMQPPSFSFE